MIFLKILLTPFSMVYWMITSFRNICYDQGWFKSYGLPVAVICVGNLKAGGTGKTPFTQFLLDHYSMLYKTAVLSRGYGRLTKGFVLANDTSASETIGDEPLQIYQHSHGRYTVAVCEDRVEGVKQLLHLIPDLALVILDDGFQHRRIKRDVNILLTEKKDPFWKDHILPSGRLRESRSGAKRADLIIITKSNGSAPEISPESISSYIGKNIPVVSTGIEYKTLQNVHGSIVLDKKTGIILVTGIGNPLPLIEYLKMNANMLEHIVFKDHHAYSNLDIETIEKLRASHPNSIVVTTEKDWVKLVPLVKDIEEAGLWYYLPIDLKMYTEKNVLFSEIDKGIKQKVRSL
ncbi:MAG: tetraacyldisaccharide 4'-kinase [Cytophagales bacterium]|nr:tetraacyldisaccharide 4'-kinase [Cytophaga sp.]